MLDLCAHFIAGLLSKHNSEAEHVAYHARQQQGESGVMEHMTAGISGNLGLTQVLEGLQDTDGFQKRFWETVDAEFLSLGRRHSAQPSYSPSSSFELSLLFGGRILVLLVLRNQVIHVGLSLCELHLVHAWCYTRLHLQLRFKHRSPRSSVFAPPWFL